MEHLFKDFLKLRHLVTCLDIILQFMDPVVQSYTPLYNTHDSLQALCRILFIRLFNLTFTSEPQDICKACL